MNANINHANRFGLQGRQALVTGSVRGLGWEIAKAMAEAGAHVIINGRDPETLADRVEELTDAGLTTSTAPFDVNDEAAVDAWFNSKTPHRTSSSTTPASGTVRRSANAPSKISIDWCRAI